MEAVKVPDTSVPDLDMEVEAVGEEEDIMGVELRPVRTVPVAAPHSFPVITVVTRLALLLRHPISFIPDSPTIIPDSTLQIR